MIFDPNSSEIDCDVRYNILQHCLGVMGFIAVIVNVALVGVSGQVEKVAPTLDSTSIFIIIVSIEVSQRFLDHFSSRNFCPENILYMSCIIGNFRFRKKRHCTICVVKTKSLISFAVTVKLTCTFVFAFVKCWFSHDIAHVISYNIDVQAYRPLCTVCE